ncbi:MAG TPA: ABC transporter permease [Aquifex aeolicus]|nr:ABC transporter permease [Aquifex aeolicus]
MKGNFFISLRLFFERRRQSVIATLGVVIGTVAFVVMSSMINGFQKYFLEEALNINGHVKIFVESTFREDRILRKVYKEGIFLVLGAKPKSVKDRISNYREILSKYAKDENLLGITLHLVGNGVISYGVKEKPATFVGIFPELENETLKISKYLVKNNLGQLERNKEAVILGIKLAEELGIKDIGKKVILLSPNGTLHRLKVVDFLNTGITEIDKSRVYLHIKKLQDILGKPNEVNEVILKLKSADLAPVYAKRLTKETGYRAESWQESFKNFLSIFKIQRIITRSVVFAILLVSGFGIFNIIMMTVLEKKRDIAILKAMGYEKRDIIFIFSLQGIIIGVFGGLAGNLLSFEILEWLETIKIGVEGIIRAEGFLLDRSISYHLQGFIFAVLVSFLASFYPAYRASRFHPVEVFRSGS